MRYSERIVFGIYAKTVPRAVVNNVKRKAACAVKQWEIPLEIDLPQLVAMFSLKSQKLFPLLRLGFANATISLQNVICCSNTGQIGVTIVFQHF